MCAADVIGVIANVVTAAAAGGAAMVAAVGLQAWKKELKGRADFDAARAMAKATYALREALNGYRSPLISGSEFPDGDMQSADAYRFMYQNRWRRVADALSNFSSAALECEALWGSPAREKAGTMMLCMNTLFVATESFINDKDANGENFRADPEFGRRTRSEVAGTLDDDKNPFSVQIRTAIATIEEMLKPHLSRT